MAETKQPSRMWQVTCQCGWRVRGTQEFVVTAVQAHGKDTHGLEVSEEEVMGLAVPLDDEPST